MNKFKLSITILLGILLLSGAISCSKDEDTTPVVDLRFLAEDEYVLPATSPEEISITVKSLYQPWEVYSYHPDWCTIEPATGDAADEYIVTIRYNDSDQLVERVDTLVIQSDYWIGKWITVRQAGTAYLELNAYTTTCPAGGRPSLSVNVSANQKWSAAVTSGEDWISITEGQTGENDGRLRYRVAANTGAERAGTITFYNYKGLEAAVLTINQMGAN